MCGATTNVTKMIKVITDQNLVVQLNARLSTFWIMHHVGDEVYKAEHVSVINANKCHNEK